MVKTMYQKMVFSVVTAEAAKIRKENPNLKQTEVIKKAWKTKAVADAKKKYEAWKAKQPATKKPAAKKTTAKKPAAKKPTKKPAGKKTTTKKPAKKPATKRKAPKRK